MLKIRYSLVTRYGRDWFKCDVCGLAVGRGHDEDWATWFRDMTEQHGHSIRDIRARQESHREQLRPH